MSDLFDPALKQKRVCVIGAGITGLTAAWQLASRGYEVRVLESTLQPGGMLSAFSLGNDRIEHIYHHIFTSDHDALALIRDLEMEQQLDWFAVRDALFYNNRLFPFSSPMDLLRFRGMPLRQRLRTGLTVLKAGRLQAWEALENITASEWLIRNCGKNAFETLWMPLLQAKFDQDALEVSAVWIWNKFKLRGGSRTKNAKSEKLGYLRGSFAALTDALINKIESLGGQINYGYTAMGLTRNDGPDSSTYTVSCILEDCSSIDFESDAVISTISCRQFSNLSISLALPDAYRNKLRSVRYKANICMVIRLKQRLSPYYWTTVCDELPFVAVIEHTNMTGSNRYNGHVVYLTRYLEVTDPVWTQPDSVLYQSFVEGLCQMYPDFSPQQILDWRLRRSRYAQPVVRTGYGASFPELDTPEKGIKLAGMAQIYPEDRGINYSIRLGRKAAQSVIQYLDTV